MKNFSRCLLFFILLFLVACQPNDPEKLWFYTHSTDNNTVNDTLLMPSSFLYLKKDGSFTRDFGAFEYGQWKKKEDTILLTIAGNVTTTLTIKYVGSKDLQLITGEKILANFEAQPSTFTSTQKDPFALVNNRWRIKATHKEPELEIRKRLRNHCQFWEAYFTWALDNNLSVVDVRSTPTLIKIYGNGFGLKPFEELPAAWRSYFYDTEDCKIANNLIHEIFQFHEISWPHTESKYKMFISAFQQLETLLKSM